MTIHEKLVAIQSSLKVPKIQNNTFGKYKYRSCEDILEAVKPHLKEHELVLTISDEIVEVGGRVYVKATAGVSMPQEEEKLSGIAVTAYARESETKKGMDDAQITGSASSYARKYALNGLFCIDDTKDADATNDHGKTTEEPKPLPTPKGPPKVEQVMEALTACKDAKALETVWTNAKKYQWSEQDLKTISECKDNVLNKLVEKEYPQA